MANAVMSGDRRATARAISLVENNSPEAQKLSSLLYPHTGKACLIGITGPGGAGKSTLVEKMVKEFRKRGKTVGVVAVDPTSPFSGGAFLGDRIRMQNLSTDEGVFIRSMATRGNPGGIAKATKDAVRILDASGKDIVIVETVGAGQSEVDIIKIAQTVVVVLAPGLGDEIQAIKAGIMEIGDIFVVNKADRENADKAVVDIKAMLELNSEKEGRDPAIVKTVAITGQGTDELLEEIDNHQEYLKKTGSSPRQQEILETELIEAIKDKAVEHIIPNLKKEGVLNKLLLEIMTRKIDPYTVAEKILKQKLKSTKDEKDKAE